MSQQAFTSSKLPSLMLNIPNSPFTPNESPTSSQVVLGQSLSSSSFRMTKSWENLVQLQLSSMQPAYPLTLSPIASPVLVQNVSFNFDNFLDSAPTLRPAHRSAEFPTISSLDSLADIGFDLPELEPVDTHYSLKSESSPEEVDTHATSTSDEDFDPSDTGLVFPKRSSRMQAKSTKYRDELYSDDDDEAADDDESSFAAKRGVFGRRKVADAQWTHEELTMSTIDFHKYLKTCSYSRDQIDELKKARRRKSNRKFARVSRNRRLNVDLPIVSDDEDSVAGGDPITIQLQKKEKKLASLQNEVARLRKMVDKPVVCKK